MGKGSKRFTVKVKLNQEDTQALGRFLECLRYAQIIDFTRHDDLTSSITIYPPKSVDPKPWAQMNANRMRTFGFQSTAVDNGN